MDIAGLSMTLSQSNLMNQVGTAVLAKTLDTAQTQGENLTKMMELSVNPQLGANLDVLV